MAKSNFDRMIQMAEEVFDVRNDPEQLDVNEKTIEHLKLLHPATLSEYDDGQGPAIWILLIPTTQKLMKQFIEGKITERELLKLTPLNISFEAIYLCSAMVLPEYRKKGMAKQLTIEAIESIRKAHPVKTLFVWPFSKEGKALAQSISKATSLPLLIKEA